MPKKLKLVSSFFGIKKPKRFDQGEYAHIKTATSELKLRMDHIISIDAIEAKNFKKGHC